MTLLAPWGLVAAGLAPVIVLLYVLRGIRQQRIVPSIQLWEGEARQISAHAGWRRPPLELLLLLQLAFVLLGTLALARPALPGPPRNNVIVVVDASASMQSQDGFGATTGARSSRFDEARRVGLQAVEQIGQVADVTLIRATGSPSVAYAGDDLQEFRRVLAGLTPGSARSDMQTAFDMAAAVAAHAPQDRNQIVIVSDGAYAPLSDTRGVSSPVRFLLVGRTTGDVAVTSVAARRNSTAANILEGFAAVVNNSSQALDVPVRATADSTPLEIRQVHLEPRARAELIFSLPPGTTRFGVSLEASDVLALNNAAETTVEAALRRRVTLVSNAASTLASALRALPNVDLTVELPDQYAPAASDLTVFDRFLPETLPVGSIVVVHPPAGSSLVRVGGEVADLEATDVDVANPMLWGVDAAALRFSGAGIVQAPTWATTVLWSNNVPLLLYGQLDGRRVVVMGFDPDQSRLEQTAAWPLLIANAVNWAIAPVMGTRVAPGEQVLLSAPTGASAVEVVRPDGTVGQAELRGATAVWRDTDALGSYVARAQGPGETRTLQTFDVRLPDDEPIEIAPLRHTELVTTGSPEPTGGPPRDIWTWVVLVAALVCAGEWWYFARHG